MSVTSNSTSLGVERENARILSRGSFSGSFPCQFGTHSLAWFFAVHCMGWHKLRLAQAFEAMVFPSHQSKPSMWQGQGENIYCNLVPLLDLAGASLPLASRSDFLKERACSLRNAKRLSIAIHQHRHGFHDSLLQSACKRRFMCGPRWN